MKEGNGVLKIAMVDDSSLIVEKIKEAVSEVAGVEFVGNAAGFSPALDLLQTARPDALILDINLGDRDGKTGIDLLCMVRNIYPSMKILMLTNLAGDKYRRLCYDGGADYFFDKSNDFSRIPETLRQIIDSKGDC